MCRNEQSLGFPSVYQKTAGLSFFTLFFLLCSAFVQSSNFTFHILRINLDLNKPSSPFNLSPQRPPSKPRTTVLSFLLL